ncbi:TRAP transporter small permease [Nitratireductor aquimarinus]|uniref:TRAP transporter small permease n=1 Tax=Nitratireductor aquimarinus TaxID=889300 RepID=UPI0029353B58|nr:TRAP transporter small permease [Nitratireductor aquimarinus]MDV2968515.1 TRAP transporter small permease [Nitratireductor aquimarinus]
METALRAVAALCLAGLTLLVTFQVVARYGMGSVPIFTEEVARYAMIWMALLAAAVGVREASHIRIDFVPGLLAGVAPRLSLVLEAVLDLVSLTAFLVLVWYGIDMVMFASGQTSEGLRLPLSYPYLAVPVSFVFAALFSLLRLKERVSQS